MKSPRFKAFIPGQLQHDQFVLEVCSGFPCLPLLPGHAYKRFKTNPLLKMFLMYSYTLREEENSPQDFLWQYEKTVNSALADTSIFRTTPAKTAKFSAIQTPAITRLSQIVALKTD